MIYIPVVILIFGAGLLSGIKLTNWAIKHRMEQQELLRRFEAYYNESGRL